MALLISVAPVGAQWAVRSEISSVDQLFDSGGRAEAAARRLADQFAEAGHHAEVEVYLRDGALAGRHVHRPRGGLYAN